jgi:hypothetical protein
MTCFGRWNVKEVDYFVEQAGVRIKPDMRAYVWTDNPGEAARLCEWQCPTVSFSIVLCCVQPAIFMFRVLQPQHQTSIETTRDSSAKQLLLTGTQ